MRFPSHTIALFLFPSLFCNAQEYEYIPFPTENASWHFDYLSMDCPPTQLCSQRNVAVANDTVINGLTYTNINLINNGQLTSGTLHRFREDTVQRKVYGLEDGEEHLVYDFSLMVGDTFFDTYPTAGWPGPGAYYVVSGIDTILVGSSLRKKFTFTGVLSMEENGFWIEGMGGGSGPFMSLDAFESWTILRCFTHHDELLYSKPFPYPPHLLLQQHPWYEYCDTSIVGIVEVKKSIRPTTLIVHGSEVRIPDFGSGTSQYTIYSVLGQQQMEGNVTNGIMQLPYLPPGIYVLRLWTRDEQIVYKLINP